MTSETPQPSVPSLAAAAAIAPPAIVRAPLADRTRGLAPDVRKALAHVGQLIDQKRLDDAERVLAGLAAIAGKHPEFLRMSGVTNYLQKRHREASDLLRHAIRLLPNDALLQMNLGSVLRGSGNHDGAVHAFARASDLDPTLPEPWFNLGKALIKQSRTDDAIEAFDHALRRDPAYVAARLARADILFTLGRIDESAAEYRRVLVDRPTSSAAWMGLSNIKTQHFTDADTAALEHLYAAEDTPAEERTRLGFCLGKALEDRKRHAEAFAVLSAANASKRLEVKWNSAFFSSGIDAVIAEFSRPHAHASNPSLGNEVIFVVSMPRAGSTLTEQILSAHADVEGAGELPDLAAVIDQESRRRSVAYPDWIGAASAADWERLGREYLQRTERRRRDRPRSTDKGLSNWALIGAAHAMLPGARFVNSRRDAVETCWSCFKQLFHFGQTYSYDLDELAAQWRDHDRLMRFWQARHPHRVYELGYERLVEDPDTEIRRLLEFCNLPFDENCLRFNESTRVVRTVSGAQVRQPMRKDTARSAAYGELLSPLRWALGLEKLSL